MAELRLTCNKSAKISGVNAGTNYSSDQYATDLNAGALLLGFPSSSELGNKKISRVSFYAFIVPYIKHDAYTGTDTVMSAQLQPHALEEAWIENTVTWNTQPGHGSRYSLITSGSNVSGGMYVEGSYEVVTDSGREYLKNILSYGMYCEVWAYEYAAIDGAQVATSRAPSNRRPYLVIEYEDTPVHLGFQSLSPTSGNYPRVMDTQFRWHTVASGKSLDEVTVQSTKFRWRPAGESSYTEIDRGTAEKYTVPANTFTSDRIEWQVAVTDNFGNVSVSDWYTITTNDVLYTCEIVSPKNEVVDGSKPVPIQFRVNNPTGLAPESIRFDYRNPESSSWWGWTAPGSSWTNWSTSGILRSWTMPVSNQIPIGEVRLRMYVTNSEGAVGPDAYSTITRVAAPAAPSVSADAVPRAVIRWQASGQLAYRVTVDGAVYGPYFGTANSYQVAELLADGEHTATVEIQGEYSLWSAPGKVGFTVSNTPPSQTLRLVGSADIDALLTLQPSWTGPYDFWIYRDGERIDATATASATQFVDRLSLGPHRYLVRAVFASGNYLESNEVSLSPACRTMAIAPLEGGDWVRCETSANSSRAERYRYSKSHSLRHFRGAKYPVLELSAYEDLIASFEAAFMDRALAESFWALRGRIVIVKARDEVTVGLLANVTKTRTKYLYSYTFDVEQIDQEDQHA